jgi:hypothetical protein
MFVYVGTMSWEVGILIPYVAAPRAFVLRYLKRVM